MFSKIKKTRFPLGYPLLIWDGECGFCKYWIMFLKNKISNKVKFETYQNAASNFEDIPLIEFKKASRFIDSDGNVFSGPDSLYKALTFSENKYFDWHLLYKQNNAFRIVSDYGYNFIAKNRSFMFKVTKVFFGKNPQRIQHYWIIYFILLISLFSVMSFYL